MKSRQLRLAFQVHPRLFGGQERFMMRLLEELRGRGHHCLVVSSPAGRVLTEFERNGFEVVRLSGRHFATDCRRLGHVLRSMRIDVAQTNLYSPLMAVSASGADVPHVWRVGGHPDLALYHEPRGTREALVQWLGASSAAIVCNSRFVATRLRELAAGGPRVIPNGVPIRDALPAPPSGGVTGASNMVLLGHYYPQKRHQDFIRAAAEVHGAQPRVRFRIYGSSFGVIPLVQHRRRMQALADSLGLRGVLAFKTAASADEAVSWSDVVVLPTVGESCSNALLEAMAAGRTVVAARSGGNSELILDRVRGRLFTPKDPRELATILSELAGDPETRRRLGAKAHQRVQARHSMKTCADAYEKIYLSLAG